MFHVKHILSVNERARLQQYVDLLLFWNKRINLIGAATSEEVWERHINDCAQLRKYIPENKSLIDLGTGGGLPGIVLSILLTNPIILVESDQRKCVFLREVKRQLRLNYQVIEGRIEQIENFKSDIIISRALAPLYQLLVLSQQLMKLDSEMILLKGGNHCAEIEEAQGNGWSFDFRTFKSETSCNGVILEVKNIKNRG